MKEELLSDYLKEYFQNKSPSLNFVVWLDTIDDLTRYLKGNIADNNREEILRLATELLYNQIGFNLLIAGPHQLGLIDSARQEEMETVIQKSDEAYQEAMEILGDIDLFDAFKRVHNLYMENTEEAKFKDLL